MMRVTTASRLHFGLLAFPEGDGSGTRWPNLHGEPTLPARRFGGVGLMVERPGLCLTARPAPEWSAAGPLAERALTFARHALQSCPGRSIPPQHLVVEHCPPEHTGLGTGTQLGLAVARALEMASGSAAGDVTELARQVGRGFRSALGIHGFAQGGFLVEAGKGAAAAIAPLVARLPFPEPWRVVVALPSGGTGRHGVPEIEAFQQLAGTGPVHATSDALCRLVLLGMLPALVEHDLEAFGEAVYDINARVGEVFAPVQGGTYSSPRTAELVNFVRRQGVRGVGQSSWGPAVFAVVGDEKRAEHLVSCLREQFLLTPAEVFSTRACNRGASLESA